MSSMKSTALNLEHDCTSLCKSFDHGLHITQALTKRAVTDDQLAAYINWICANCGEVCDKEGRTALHVAVSCGRLKLALYLIHVHGAAINLPDIESGCTALHRAVFYGQLQVAVHLMRLGAETTVMDNGCLTPIDYAMRDRYPSYDLKDIHYGEIYVWGSNENYTLGTGNQQSRGYPDLLEFFRKENISIKQVSLHKFHTLFLTSAGHVYSCGHGQGGRLGNGHESAALFPQLIKFVAPGLAQEPCVEISAGLDHSLFVMDSGIVWSCGLNAYSQLGHQDSPKFILTPRPLKSKLSSVQHVCATRFHSVAWGRKGVYTWGLNSGQLGHDKTAGEFISTPKRVSGLGNSEITSVAASDGATVITTSSGIIYVLHEFQCRKIGSKRHNIVSVSVIGGHLSPSNALSHVIKEEKDYLRILVLTIDGLLYTWTEASPHLIRCIFSIKRPLTIKSVALNLHNVYLTTECGEVFKGEFQTNKMKKDNNSGEQRLNMSPFTNFLNRHECAMIKVMRIPNIYRAITVVSDMKGKNCAVIQGSPIFGMINLPRVSRSIMSEQMLDLFENASVDDSLHDIEFKVGIQIIPAHRYIVFKSSRIKELYETVGVNGDPIQIDNIAPEIFIQLLKYMYAGSCDLLRPGVCSIVYSKIDGSENDSSEVSPIISEFDDFDKDLSAFEVYNKLKKRSKAEKKLYAGSNMAKDPVRQLQYCAKYFGILDLYSELDRFRFDNGVISVITNDKKIQNSIVNKTLSRAEHSDLQDVTIQTETNNKIIKAHRCVLVARLEYFYGMFMHEWHEKKSNAVIKLPYSHRVLEVVIDFLYTDTLSEMDAYDDIDFISQLMIVADQLFIVRLREMCEIVLTQYVTLKNVATFLQFSNVYNSVQLHEYCVYYICLNLAPLLENRSLDILPDEILEELARKYMYYNKHMSSRIITPYSTAPKDEEILEIYQRFAVDIRELSEANKKKPTPKKKIVSRKTSESERTRSRNESITESPKIITTISIIENVTQENNDKIATSVKMNEHNSDELQKRMTVVQSRLKAITLAQNIDVKECFQNISSKSEITEKSFSGFPELGMKSLENKTQIPSKNLNEVGDTPIKKSSYTKLSQKQRKKLFAQNVAEKLNKINTKDEPQVPVSPWGVKGTGQDSFADILKNEQKLIPVKGYHQNILSKSPDDNSITQTDELNSHNPSIVSNGRSGVEQDNLIFSNIIADERQQRENYSRMKSKPLVLTQIEDKAIEDLEKFYNIDEVDDETIIIARECKAKYASPLWIQKQINKN